MALGVVLESRLRGYRVPRFTRKTRNTGKTIKILERPKNNREIKYDS